MDNTVANKVGRLTTHVLDTAHGRPAGGMQVDLLRLEGDERVLLKIVQTNADGRVNGSLLEGAELGVGMYELEFHVGHYFAALGVESADPRFLEVVPVRFGVSDPAAHYHVPLLVSPFGYSTYRGS